MSTTTASKFSPEVGERAVRMVSEHRADHRSEWQNGLHGGDAAPLVPGGG